MKTSALLCLLILFFDPLFAQNQFTGILISKADSTPITNAAITLTETGQSTLTDGSGSFKFLVPSNIAGITLNISAIGCKATVHYPRPFGKAEVVYVDVLPNVLGGISIRGLSAEEVVRKAIRSIPANYADSSHAAYGMHRQYQKVNGRFTNLIEMQMATMFRITKTKKEISSREAFAIRQFRRTPYEPNPSNVNEDNPADLMAENPVYHLADGALSPGKLLSYNLRFDTANKTRDYVIRYTCNKYSSEKHGWYDRDYWAMWFKGESEEEGRMVIDRESFAIKSIDRIAARHPDYVYPVFPIPHNLVGGVRKYYMEFVNADLHAEYTQTRGKWYLHRLCHQYTDEFYLPTFETKDFVVTDVSEWVADSVSRYVTKDILKKFVYRPVLGVYLYNKDFWDGVDFPFWFFSKESVYRDLEKRGPVEKQFSSSGINEK